MQTYRIEAWRGEYPDGDSRRGFECPDVRHAAAKDEETAVNLAQQFQRRGYRVLVFCGLGKAVYKGLPSVA